MYKYINKEHTQIHGNGKTIPITHRLYREEVLPFIIAGGEVEPYTEDVIKPRVKIKEDRDLAMSSVTIAYDSKDWTFRAIDMQRLMAKFNLGRDFGWKSDDNSISILTPAMGKEIALLIDDAMTQAFMDAEAKIEAL